MQLDWQLFTREVERMHTRYQTEVVEAFGLCPWAKDARSGGRVRMHVSFMTTADAPATLQLLDLGMARAETEISLLIFPLLPLSRLEFAHFVASVRAADDARTPRGKQRFALAEFHPSAAVPTTISAATAHALIPFLRRAPDPMIQSVKMDVLARVRGSENHGTSYIDPERLADFALGGSVELSPPPLAARVAQHNQRTVERVGVAEIERVYRAIQQDRARSYAALGVTTPTHAYMDDTDDATTSNQSENSPHEGG